MSAEGIGERFENWAEERAEQFVAQDNNIAVAMVQRMLDGDDELYKPELETQYRAVYNMLLEAAVAFARVAHEEMNAIMAPATGKRWIVEAEGLGIYLGLDDWSYQVDPAERRFAPTQLFVPSYLTEFTARQAMLAHGRASSLEKGVRYLEISCDVTVLGTIGFLSPREVEEAGVQFYKPKE